MNAHYFGRRPANTKLRPSKRRPFVDLTSPLAAIGHEMLTTACGSKMLARCAASEPLIVAIVVDPRWLHHVAGAFSDAAPIYSCFMPSARGMNNKDLLEAVAVGEPTVAFVAHVADLPDPVASIADYVVDVPLPSPGILRRVIRRLTGVDPGRAPRPLESDVDPDAVAACFRPGTPARRIVKLLDGLGNDDVAATAPARPISTASGPMLEDLFGYGPAKDWALALREGVDRLRRGEITFVDLPMPAAILSGPPGTGKTSFARAFAHSCRMPLVETSVSQWFTGSSGYLDGVTKAAKKAMDEAREAAGDDVACLLFDELDSLPDRSRLTDRGREWWTPVVTNILQLTELGSPTRSGVILIGATNHGDRLDAALVRPGRFEQIFHIDLPDVEAVVGILGAHAPELSESDRRALAPLLVRRSGADLAGIARSARAIATAGGERLGTTHLLSAALPEDGLDPASRRLVAVHEAGHAIVAAAVGIEISTVTVFRDGVSGGRMSGRMPSLSPTRADLEAMVTVALGGRAADEIFGVGPGAGAASDLVSATKVLVDIHASYGLGRNLIAFPEEVGLRAILSEGALREAVEADLARLYENARSILQANRAAHARLAEVLAARRLLSGEQAREVMGAIRWHDGRTRGLP